MPAHTTHTKLLSGCVTGAASTHSFIPFWLRLRSIVSTRPGSAGLPFSLAFYLLGSVMVLHALCCAVHRNIVACTNTPMPPCFHGLNCQVTAFLVIFLVFFFFQLARCHQPCHVIDNSMPACKDKKKRPPRSQSRPHPSRWASRPQASFCGRRWVAQDGGRDADHPGTSHVFFFFSRLLSREKKGQYYWE